MLNSVTWIWTYSTRGMAYVVRFSEEAWYGVARITWEYGRDVSGASIGFALELRCGARDLVSAVLRFQSVFPEGDLVFWISVT